MPLYQRIVLTAGISILTNKRDNIEKHYPAFFSQTERMKEKQEQIIDSMIDLLKKEIFDGPFDEQSSAEIAMIAALQNQNKLHKHPVITILHTDTVNGVIAGRIIQDMLKKHFSAHVSLKRIFDVDVNNRNALSKSLGYFLGEVSQELLKGEPSSTCFAPIGGYKVMTSLGYLVGAFHRYPTAYLHEGSNMIHQIPPVHIQVNEDFIEEHHPFLRKMLKETIVEMKDLTAEEQKLVEKETTFFTVEEDLVELNPFGQFLCNQSKFAHYFQPKVSIDRDVFQAVEKKLPAYTDFVMAEIHDLIIKHQDFFAENEGVLFHEKAFKVLNASNLNCHLFKGTNHPHVFRAIWHYDGKEDRYYIGKIWFDHQDYERQAAASLKAFDIEKIDWEDITERVYPVV